MAHATTSDLSNWLPDTIPVPADANRILDRASEVIDAALKTAVYDPDETADVLANATCAQVEYWLTGDEEDDVLGPLQGLILNGLQLQYGAGTNRATPTYLAPRAWRILNNAGLITGRVGTQ